MKKLWLYFSWLVIGLGILWCFVGWNLTEDTLKKFDAGYAAYNTELAKYEQKVKELNLITVYVTAFGSRYHRNYHYRNRNSPIGLADAVLSGHTPCMTCNPYQQGVDNLTQPKYQKAWWVDLGALVVWLLGFVVTYKIVVFLQTAFERKESKKVIWIDLNPSNDAD